MALIKFKYSEKATKFCEISTLILSVCTVDKSNVEISQNFVAFLEYTNFNTLSSKIAVVWYSVHKVHRIKQPILNSEYVGSMLRNFWISLYSLYSGCISKLDKNQSSSVQFFTRCTRILDSRLGMYDISHKKSRWIN